MTPDEYCREIEAYLCRKNDGHLVRIVGPSFERVAGWAERGIPMKVAWKGIDRYFERYYARGPRRRPVRIDFCEPDVLDAFDEWRRAVGMPSGGTPDSSGAENRTRMSLPAHLDRVILLLTALRGGAGMTPVLDAALERAARELDLARSGARSLRGEARARFMARLEALDLDLVAAARAACGLERMARYRAEAEGSLEPFRARMPDGAYDKAVEAAIDRLVREAFGLPDITFE